MACFAQDETVSDLHNRGMPAAGFTGIPRVNLPGAAAIALLALISYAGVWSYGYTSDDIAIPFRLMRDGWAGIAPFLSPSTGGTGFDGYLAYFRPSWVLLSAAEYVVFGLTPAVPHVVNLVMYVITCVLVYHLVSIVTGDDRTALWSALIFTLHPIHTWNVIWISGRTDGIATLGVLASIVSAIYWRGNKGWSRHVWLAVTVIAALVGLGGKEMAYLLPALAVATYYVRRWDDGGTQHERLREAVLTATPAIVAVALWGLWIVLGSSFISGFRWTTAPHLIVTYLAGAVVLLFNPFDYETLIRLVETYPILLAVGGLFIAVAVAGGLWLARRDASIIWGMAWLLIGIMPLYRMTLRWYLLLPSVGAAVVMGTLLRRAEQTRWSRGATVGAVVVVALFATGLARERGKWSEADELGRSALQSLVELADRTRVDAADLRPIVLMTTPHKLHRMAVFAGNTESFLYLATGYERRVDVVTTVALELADAEIAVKWLSPTQVAVSIDEGDGSFLTTIHPASHSSGGSVETILSDSESATVTARSRQNRAISIEANIPIDEYEDPVWAVFSGGGFVEIEPPPVTVEATVNPNQQAGSIQ
jgi:hypothetical protein